MPATAHSASAKTSILEWIRLIKAVDQGRTKYYMPKAIELFLTLPDVYQYGLLKFVAERLENDIWLEKIQDNTQYIDVLRSILFYYSGQQKAAQPCRLDFNNCLGEYVRSSYFTSAEDLGASADFKHELESL